MEPVIDILDTLAWRILIENLISDEKLLPSILPSLNDLNDIRNDLKSMLRFPPEMVAAVMTQEYVEWRNVGKPKLIGDRESSIAEMLCYFMDLFGEAAARRHDKKLH